MIKFTKKQTGDKGEKYTVDYLKRHKYKILERNYSCRYGEIDIIAENNEYVIFVEVKTRHTNPYTSPASAVDYRKQKRIITTASKFLSEYETEKFSRFDVSEVFVDEETLKLIDINYIESAFETR